MEPLVGIEPPTLLTRQVPSQMATRGVVPVQGFEPRSSASKTAVLPLDDTGAEPSAGIVRLTEQIQFAGFVQWRQRMRSILVNPRPWSTKPVHCPCATKALVRATGIAPVPSGWKPDTLLLRQAR